MCVWVTAFWALCGPSGHTPVEVFILPNDFLYMQDEPSIITWRVVEYCKSVCVVCVCESVCACVTVCCVCEDRTVWIDLLRVFIHAC